MSRSVDALLAERGIELVRADNPGPMTLEGTNTWLVPVEGGQGAGGALVAGVRSGDQRSGGGVWVVDPGPDLDAHLDAVAERVAARGGLAGVALTHRHADHAGGVAGLLRRAGPAPIASRSGWSPADAPPGTDVVVVADGDRAGPLAVMATPGHAQDHIVFVAGDACCCGDTVLGRGSVLLVPHPEALAGYLDALARLRERDLRVLLPGHGPIVADPDHKLVEYVDHRLERERRLVAALDAGERTVAALLDAVWDDAPGDLRLAAAVTLQAHLDKLDGEGRLPEDVERQTFAGFDGL